jgi:hypothetical protein
MGAIVEWSVSIVINYSKRNFESILDQIDRFLTGEMPNLDLIRDVGVILAEHLDKLVHAVSKQHQEKGYR